MTIPLRQYWRLLATYLRSERRRAALLAALLVSSIALQLANPQILRYFIDAATAGAAMERLMAAAGLFVALAILNQVIAVGATYVGENVAWSATNRLRTDLLAHCLGLDQSFHKARTPGEMIERVDGDVTALSNFFSQFVIHVLSNLALLVGVLVLLFREDWRIGVGLALFALFALVTLARIQSVAVPYWAAVRQRSADFFGFLGEHLAGTEDIRANGAGRHVMRRFYEQLRGWLPVRRKAGLWGYSMWITTLVVFTVGNAVAFGLGGYLWSAGAISIGTVYIIFHYTELLRQPIEMIRHQMEDLQRAAASIARVEELLGTRSRLAEGPGAPLPAGPLSVEFDDVAFGYDQGEPVLDEVSFQLQPGKVLGLLGRTGSGKTTLARLLLRLYDPTTGEIRLGGVSTREPRLRDLRQRVGMVTQDVQLFGATVRDNLALFDRGIPDERMLDALHELGLGDWYRSLPAGLDTELAAGGGTLSAGQAQLLAFARLFLSDPGLVILDEASSRLDPATEALIEQAVGRLVRGEGGGQPRTAIIIAHRLHTVEQADEILILEDGRVLEYGARKRLAADPRSHFSTLLRTGLVEVLA